MTGPGSAVSRRILPVLAGLLLLVHPSRSQEAARNFSAANELYRAGRYAEAVKVYEQIVSNGYESAALYYNLGNAHYKSGSLPAAILNYERAKRLSPGDEDIAHNLRLANLRIVDKIDPIPRLFIAEWWDSLIGLESASDWGIAAICALWAAALSLAAFRILRGGTAQRVSLAVGIAAILFGAFAFTAGGIQGGREEPGNSAILFTPTASVKSAPDAQSTDLFVLHEGVKLDLMDAVGEWRKIRLADGKVGWLPAEEMKVI